MRNLKYTKNAWIMIMFLGLLVLFVSAVVVLVSALAMIDPVGGEISEAQRDLRVCQYTEGCNSTKIQEKIDLLEGPETKEARQYWASILGEASIGVIAGGMTFVLGIWGDMRRIRFGL